jgi:hypothetical protein
VGGVTEEEEERVSTVPMLTDMILILITEQNIELR